MILFFSLSTIIVLIVTCVYQRRKYHKLADFTLTRLDKMRNHESLPTSLVSNTVESAILSKLTDLNSQLHFLVAEERNSKKQVNQFISDLSHQIRTPLTNVIMYNDLLKSPNLLTESAERTRTSISSELEKINWILDSLFKSVYLEEDYLHFEAEQLPLKPTISAAISAQVQQLLQKEIEISVLPFNDDLVIHNKKWTVEALSNIIHNSIKYSKSGTCIEVAITKGELFTEISITDQGMGIPVNDLNHVRKRFFRSKNAENFEGSGIGLFLVNQIIEKQQGYMTIESQINQGTKVSLYLQNAR